MSTRQRYGQQRFGPAPKRSAFGGAEVARAQLSWRDMQPILLRSAALVGLAAAVAAVISNDAFFARPEPRPPQEAVVLIVQEEPDGARNVATAESLAAPMTAAAAAPAAVASDPGMAKDAPADPVPPDWTGEAAITTHAPPPTMVLAPPAEAPATTPAAAEPAVAAPAPPPAVLALTDPAPVVPPADLDEAATEPSPLASIPAADCPRDWVSAESQAAVGDRSCEELAALMPAGADPAEQHLLEEAALVRAAEIAALQFVPRIPQARPDPPPRPRKSARKAKWPAGAPPNCGNRHAYWRYVNKVPTWYCR